MTHRSYSSPKSTRLKYLLYPGIVLLIVGLSILFCSGIIYKHVVNSSLRLEPGSTVYQAWSKTSSPAYLEIFFHNWTNPQDGHNDTVKPKFQEIGPFRFKEFKEKVNITWNKNDTVTYMQKKTWIFDEATSCCSLSTNITTLNAVLVTASHKSRTWNGLLRAGLSVTLRAFTPHLAVTKNASELIFDGYVDQLLTIMPSPTDRFGWFYPKNGSAELTGVFNMNLSPAHKGELLRWNNKNETSFYEGECANVRGSAGELYPIGQNKKMTSFFSPDMCRNIAMDYEKEEVVHGVTGYRYIAYNRMLDNGTLYPENECYCGGQCMPSGVLNVSSCRLGSPSFVSLPHFLHGDPIYVNDVEGVNPDKDKHQFFMVIEPNTGIPIHVNIRMQMNMHLKPIDYMTIINDVPTVMFPILWFQVEAKASEAFASNLSFLLRLPSILKTTAGICVAISLPFLLIGILKSKNDRGRPTVREEAPLQRRSVSSAG